jgi:hypothetical protein
LAAYTSGNNAVCINRLVRLAALLPPVPGSAQAILRAVGAQPRPPETEEALLAVFLVRRLTGG